MQSRKERVAHVRDQVEKEWPWYWYNWITGILGPRVNYDYLSFNPNITLDIIETTPDKPWKWELISELPTITLDDVLRHIDKPWDWFTLSYGLDLSMYDILNNPGLPWDWSGLSMNKCKKLPFSDIIDNIHLPWEWYELSANSKITLDMIDKNPSLPWCYLGLSQNRNLTIEFINANLDKSWVWSYISQNPGIKLEDITSNPDLPWNWCHICRNPNINMDFVMQNIELDKIILPLMSIHGHLARNPVPKKHLVQSTRQKNALSTNRSISITDILRYNEYIDFNWTLISKRRDITLDIVLSNPDINWDYSSLIYTLDMSIDFINQNIYKLAWNWPLLCNNMFVSSEKEFIIQQYRRHLASYRIQQHWHRIRSNPYHPVGHKKMERDYVREFGFG
jgi:hypothetical protein